MTDKIEVDVITEDEKDTAYIAYHSIAYEGDTVLAITDKLDAAQGFAETHHQEYYSSYLTCESLDELQWFSYSDVVWKSTNDFYCIHKIKRNARLF